MKHSGERCQKFLGEKIQESNTTRHGQPTVICQKCQRRSCLLCGGRFDHDAPQSSHRCIPIDTDDAAFEGLKRGRDYQICPSDRCGMRIELSAACNAMTCRCGTQFCYVCGELAGDQSDHWTKKKPNGCPRYNQPGAPNAQFDAPIRQSRLRFVSPLPGARRTPLNDPYEQIVHGADGLRFAGLRITDSVGVRSQDHQIHERAERNPLRLTEEDRRPNFTFDNPRNRMRALVATRLHALSGEPQDEIVEAITRHL
jgi:hypothetical protein